jgi:hypothetical protein
MKVTISFGNPFLVTINTVAMPMIGWAMARNVAHAHRRLDALLREDLPSVP